MLCAAASPVKYEGNQRQHEREAESRCPDLQNLRQPVSLGRNTDPVSAGEVDLREQDGRRGDQ